MTDSKVKILCQNPVDITPHISFGCALNCGHDGPCLPNFPLSSEVFLLYKWWKQEHPDLLEKHLREILG